VAPAHAATTWTVTKTADTNDGVCDSDCSLREAITKANADSGDTVVVPAGDYTLATSELTVSASMTISGAGAGGTVIHAAPNSRVLEMSAGTVTISGVTLTGGNIGGAEPTGAGLEKTGGSLTLVNSAVTGNTSTSNAAGPRGGGIDNVAGDLTVLNSTISENHLVSSTQNTMGGGIWDGASSVALTISGSRIAGNTSGKGSGGGIFSNTGFQISGTTIDGNEADGSVGGGVHLAGGTGVVTSSTVSNNIAQSPSTTGGGIFANAPLQVTNATITGNKSLGGGSTVGGGIHSNDTLTLTNVTLDANTANIHNNLQNNGPTTFVNTIVSNGQGSTPNNNCEQPITTSLGHNIDSGNSCGFTAAGDQINTDPKLGPLANNGGPTFTEMPALDSPALNAGLASKCPATDQRGVARPQDGVCDIGAVERTFAADLGVTATLSPRIVPLVGRLTYTIKVTNAGPDVALGVQLTNVLPPHSTVASAPPACVASGLTCSLGTLASGASTVVTLVVDPSRAGAYALAARVSGTRPDPNAANDSASVTGFAGPPSLSKLSIKPRSFAPKPRGSTFSVAKGARVRFKLSRASKVRFLIQRQRRVKGEKRYLTVRGGRVERNGRNGTNSVRFSGRVRHKPLKPGRYRLRAIPHDAGGTAKPKSVTFRIV
jgi:CSLREA domain-containing protein/uncharacterized repeat protein (TIGR01451 family)